MVGPEWTRTIDLFRVNSLCEMDPASQLVTAIVTNSVPGPQSVPFLLGHEACDFAAQNGDGSFGEREHSLCRGVD